MMIMFDGLTVVLAFTIFFASLVRTATGFGFALIAVPILSFFLEPAKAVAITMIFQTISALPIALINITKKEWGYAIRLLLFSIIGLVPGIILLIFITPLIVHALVALCVLCALFLVAKGVTFKSQLSLHHWLTVGFFAGFMHGLAGVSGPPILAMLHADKSLTKHAKRQIMAVFFLFVGGIALFPILTYMPEILFDGQLLSILFIAMVAGMYVGQKVFIYLSTSQFRLCTLILMSVSCVLVSAQLVKLIVNIL